MRINLSALFLFALLSVIGRPSLVHGQDTLADQTRLIEQERKPFVLVEATAKQTINRAQGVVISPQGHVLSAGHVAYVTSEQSFADRFRVSLRGRGTELPNGFAHVHKTVFADREGAEFYEHFYQADLILHHGSRFIAASDLALFKIRAEGKFPTLKFYSAQKPAIQLGETLYLCHYNFPHQPADPTFLINPVKVVGVAQTSSGLQFLGEGYYRVGSSGGALLKDGRLIGIQSAAYTVNAKGIGEVPLGLVSFQLVWRDLFKSLLPEIDSENGSLAQTRHAPATPGAGASTSGNFDDEDSTETD